MPAGVPGLQRAVTRMSGRAPLAPPGAQAASTPELFPPGKGAPSPRREARGAARYLPTGEEASGYGVSGR